MSNIFTPVDDVEAVARSNAEALYVFKPFVWYVNGVLADKNLQPLSVDEVQTFMKKVVKHEYNVAIPYTFLSSGELIIYFKPLADELQALRPELQVIPSNVFITSGVSGVSYLLRSR